MRLPKNVPFGHFYPIAFVLQNGYFNVQYLSNMVDVLLFALTLTNGKIIANGSFILAYVAREPIYFDISDIETV